MKREIPLWRVWAGAISDGSGLCAKRVHVPLIWHERMHNDPGLKWIRSLLRPSSTKPTRTPDDTCASTAGVAAP